MLMCAGMSGDLVGCSDKRVGERLSLCIYLHLSFSRSLFEQLI